MRKRNLLVILGDFILFVQMKRIEKRRVIVQIEV